MVTNLPMFFVDNVPLDLVLKEICSPKSTSASMSDNSISSNNSMMGIIPKLDNQRLKNQDGYFACLTYAGQYQDVFNPIEDNSSIKERIIIPSKSKKTILKELYHMGIKESFVFPELENQIRCILHKYK